MRNLQLALIATVAATAIASAQERPAPGPDEPPEIMVTGTGTVTLSPDYAVVQLSVVTRGVQAARAGQENARVMTAVRAALRSLLGVPEDSLPTVAYSVDTQYERDRPIGYQARSAIEAHARDLARVGAVIDAALNAGATNVSGIRFESTKGEAGRLEAVARAVQAARREAEAIARAAGGRLGALLGIATSGPIAYPMREMAAVRAMAVETPIAPPGLEVTATVSARWAFVPQ